MSDEAYEATLDGRKRLPLGSLKVKQPLSKRYRVEEHPGGELWLIPVVSLTKAEIARIVDEGNYDFH